METTKQAVEFFYANGPYSWDPRKETEEEGRRRCAESLAEAEAWAKRAGVEFNWEDDWEVGDHGKYYGRGSAYGERDPETCEQATATLNGEVVASLGCIDDATTEYRRVVEAELAQQARSEVVDLLVGAADKLYEALATMNAVGDSIDTRIATQADGLPWGEVYDGLKALLRIVLPGKGDEVLEAAFAESEKPSVAWAALQREES